jgi:tetratricopeptide (TPR) repeat protein
MENGWQQNYELGRKAFEEKRYDAALECLEKVVKEKKNFADVFNMLGLLYYHSSRFELAMKAFQRALEINPYYTEAALNLSVVLNELGRFDESREKYSAARNARGETGTYLDQHVKGKIANMHADLGLIYKDLGCYTEAVDEYRKALALRPEFVDIKVSLGTVYRDMRDFSSSVRELSEAAALNPLNPVSRVQLGLTYYVMGFHEKARTEWLKVLEAHPSEKMARMYLNLLATA